MEYKDVHNDLVVKGTAVLLKTNVKVFSFDPATKSLTETIYRSRQQLCNKDTIVLGHITDKHFVPLRIKQSSMPLRKRPLSQTSMHSFFKMPRNSAHLQPPSSTSNLPTSPQVSRKTFQRPLADQVLTSSTSESSTLTGNDNESPASESSTGPRASPSASGVSSDPWPQPPSMQPEKQCQSTICCKKTNSPYQPTSDVVLAKTEVIITSKRRRLIVDWYDRYPWLHLCTTNYKAYCFMCMHANHHPGSKPNSAFVSTGFNNWKKAKDKFDEHEKSHFHRDALNDAKAKGFDISVFDQVRSQSASEQEARRKSFLNEIRALVFLLRQALPVRGHDEDEGNLRQLLKVCLEEHEWIKQKKYLSADIVNEILQIMSHTILRDVLGDIRKAKWFSIMADETRDVANREQLVICIRWVNQKNEVMEDPVGLVNLENTTANTIHAVISDCLIRLNLAMENCKGQAYDGASTFQGHLNGVAAKFKAGSTRQAKRALASTAKCRQP